MPISFLPSVSRLAFTASLVATLGACDSKSVETAPTSNEIRGLSIEERIDLQKSIDTQLSSVTDGLTGVLKVSRKLEALSQNKTESDGTYSIVDLMLEVNESLKDELPSSGASNSGPIVKIKTLHLPAWSVEPACQDIDVMGTFNLSSANEMTSMIYSVKSCETHGAFVDIATASFDKPRFAIKIDTKALEDSVGTPFVNQLKNRFDCQSTVENSTVQDIECNGLTIRLPQEVQVKINHLKVSRNNEQRLTSDADISEHGELQATATLVIHSNGKVQFDVKRVPAPAPGPGPAPSESSNVVDAE